MIIAVVRNNLSGGMVVFDNFTLEELEEKLPIYGVQLAKGERNPSGNVSIHFKRTLMLDMEREVFLDLFNNRFTRTEEHQPSFSYFIRSW